ncbi:MAG: carbohydrate kinase family protein [Planctomycetota bacterium]|jgi:sugar/nucleoside kinase (ribokinase family)
MEKTIDCVVCGSCVADVLVRPIRLDRAVGPGSLVVVDPIELATGGIVSNAGIAMTRLGLKVAALGCLGGDHWAATVRQMLQDEGILTTGLATHPTTRTTVAVALIDPSGERSFAYYPGATDEVDRALFWDQLDLFARSRAALIGYYSLLPGLEADPPEVLAEIRRRGCRVALDSGGQGGRIEPLERVLPHVDVYVPSHGEAVHQTGRTEPQAIFKAYRQCGAEGLLGVKLGAQGAVLSPSPETCIAIDPVSPPGPVVDATGAGDCFYAGLLRGLLSGMPVEKAGRLAAACGACCVTGKGATAAVRGYEETARLAGLEE